MKKFITYVSQQPEGFLKKARYRAESNDLLDYDKEVSFPIIPIINGYAEEGEKIELIVVLEDGNENCKRNFDVLKEEVDELKKDKGFSYEIREIQVSKEEVAAEHLRTFQKLLNSIEENDQLFACATYGTKPFPMVLLMALNAAYKIKKGVMVKCVAYGKVDRDPDGVVKGMIIYDITSLFFMTSLVDSLAAHPLEDPEAVIKRVLEDEEDE